MPSRTVRIGLVQNKVSGDITSNLSRSLALAREAACQGARIICLQELFRTPYFPQAECIDATAYAESIPGESTREFSAFARSYDVPVIVPLFEKGTDGGYYNSAAVIDNTGTILPPYRKVHIPHDPLFYEQKYFLRCAPRDITFNITTPNTDIKDVVFYYRVADLKRLYPSEWKSFGNMTANGNGNFTLAFSGENIHPDLRLDGSYLDFQFIGLAKDGNVVDRSEKIESLVKFTFDCA